MYWSCLKTGFELFTCEDGNIYHFVQKTVMVLIFLQHSLLNSLVLDDTTKTRLFSALMHACLSIYFIKMKWATLIHPFTNSMNRLCIALLSGFQTYISHFSILQSRKFKHSTDMDVDIRSTILQILLWDKPYSDMALLKSVFPY